MHSSTAVQQHIWIWIWMMGGGVQQYSSTAAYMDMDIDMDLMGGYSSTAVQQYMETDLVQRD